MIGAGLALAAVALPTAAGTGLGRMTVKEITPYTAPATTPASQAYGTESDPYTRMQTSDEERDGPVEMHDACEEKTRKHHKKDRSRHDRKDREKRHGDREKHDKDCD